MVLVFGPLVYLSIRLRAPEKALSTNLLEQHLIEQIAQECRGLPVSQLRRVLGTISSDLNK